MSSLTPPPPASLLLAHSLTHLLEIQGGVREELFICFLLLEMQLKGIIMVVISFKGNLFLSISAELHDSLSIFPLSRQDAPLVRVVFTSFCFQMVGTFKDICKFFKNIFHPLQCAFPSIDSSFRTKNCTFLQFVNFLCSFYLRFFMAPSSHRFQCMFAKQRESPSSQFIPFTYSYYSAIDSFTYHPMCWCHLQRLVKHIIFTQFHR